MSDYPKTVLAVLIALMMTASGLSVVFAHGQSADASDSDNAKYNDYTDDLSIFDLLDQLGDFDPFSWDFEYSIRIFTGDETIEVFDPTVAGAAMVAGHTYILTIDKDTTYTGTIEIPQGQELIILLNQDMTLQNVKFDMKAPTDTLETSLITAFGSYDATAKTLKGAGIDYSPQTAASIAMAGTLKITSSFDITAGLTYNVEFRNDSDPAVITIADSDTTTITFETGFEIGLVVIFDLASSITIDLLLTVDTGDVTIENSSLSDIVIKANLSLTVDLNVTVVPNPDGTYDITIGSDSENAFTGDISLSIYSKTDGSVYVDFESSGTGKISATLDNVSQADLSDYDVLMEKIIQALDVNISVESTLNVDIEISDADDNPFAGVYIQGLVNELNITTDTKDPRNHELSVVSHTYLEDEGYLEILVPGGYFGFEESVYIASEDFKETDTITFSGAEGVEITSSMSASIYYADSDTEETVWTYWFAVYDDTYISGDVQVEYDADTHSVGFELDLAVDNEFLVTDKDGENLYVNFATSGYLNASSEFTVSEDMDPQDALEEMYENLVLDADLESSLDVYIYDDELGLEIIIDNFYAELSFESDEGSGDVFTYSEISVDEISVVMDPDADDEQILFSVIDLSDTQVITVTYDSMEVTDSLEATIYDNEEDEWFTVAAYDDASITFDFEYDPEKNAVDFSGDFSFYSYTYLDNQEFTAIEIENGLYEAHFDFDDDITDYFTASMDASVTVLGVEIDFEDMEFDYKYVSELDTEVIYVGVPNITVDGDIVPTEYESVDEYLAGLVSVYGEVKDLSATFYLDDEDQFIPDEWTIGSAWFATSHIDGAYAEYTFKVTKDTAGGANMVVDIDVTGVVDVPEPIDTFVVYSDEINVKGDGILMVDTLTKKNVKSGTLYVGCTQYHVDEEAEEGEKITLLEDLYLEGIPAKLVGCAIGYDATAAKYVITYLPGFENNLTTTYGITVEDGTVTIADGATEIVAKAPVKEYNLTINNEDGSLFYQGKVKYLHSTSLDTTHLMPTGALWLVDSDGVVWGEIDDATHIWSITLSAYKDLTLTIVTGDKIDAPTTTDFVKVNSEKFYMEIPQDALDSYNFEHTPTGLKFTFTVDGVFIDPGDVIKMTASKTKYNGYTAFDLHSSVPVTVTFTAKEGEKLWHVVDGKAVQMDGKVVDGTITVTLFDFSTYFVQKDPNHSSSNNMLYIGIAIAAILVVAAIAAALYSKKKNAAA